MKSNLKNTDTKYKQKNTKSSNKNREKNNKMNKSTIKNNQRVSKNSASKSVNKKSKGKGNTPKNNNNVKPYEKGLINNNNQRKYSFLVLIIVLLLFVIFLRLLFIQIFYGKDLRAESQRNDRIVISAKKGNIYDSNGNELAINNPTNSIYMDNLYFNENLSNGKYTYDEAIKNIGEILELNEEELRIITHKNSRYNLLKKKVDYSATEKLKDLKYKGLIYEEDQYRYYPKGSFASDTIGFTNSLDKGVSGAEGTYDSKISGVDGFVVGEKDAKNNIVFSTIVEKEDPKDGSDLYLTIDEGLQYIADNEMKNIQNVLSPKDATIIIMETETGNIVALSDGNTYNNNELGGSDFQDYSNYAFNALYEPGSTMKPLLVATALENQVINVNDTVTCKGFMMVDNFKIKCHVYPSSHGVETIGEALSNSCNPGMIQISDRIAKKDPNLWFNTLRAFNIGKKSRVNYIGEASGIFPPNNERIYRATTSIGQGISITPIQLAGAISTIGNDGILVEPNLIKKEVKANGKEIVQTNSTKEIIKKENADLVLKMMNEVIEGGTGVSGNTKEFKSAAKTGTAQKAGTDGKYKKDAYVISFIGMAPLEDPKYTVLIVVDEGNRKARSSAALGVHYKSVMSQVMKTKVTGKQDENNIDYKTFKMPNIVGLRSSKAKEILSPYGIKIEDGGQDIIIGNQSIKVDHDVKRGVEVIVSINDKILEDETIMPNLIGKSLPEAINLLEGTTIELKFSGKGVIVAQGIEPGLVIKKGTVVTVSGGN